MCGFNVAIRLFDVILDVERQFASLRAHFEEYVWAERRKHGYKKWYWRIVESVGLVLYTRVYGVHD